MSPSPSPSVRGPFRPLRLTTNSAVDGDRRVALSPLDVAQIDATVLADNTGGARVTRRGNGGTIWVRGSVEDVTAAWQRALRADDTPSPCEWPIA